MDIAFTAVGFFVMGAATATVALWLWLGDG